MLSGKAPARLCQPQPSQAFLGELGEGQPSSGQCKQCPKYPCPIILALWVLLDHLGWGRDLPLRDARPCWPQVSNSLPWCKCAGASLLPSFLLQSFDDFIFAFFAVEMIVKMIALGIFGKKCYLGDTWNRLDFFIVIAG